MFVFLCFLRILHQARYLSMLLILKRAFDRDEALGVLVADSHAGRADDLISVSVRWLRTPGPPPLVKYGPALSTDRRFREFSTQLIGVVLILLDSPIVSSSQASGCLRFGCHAAPLARRRGC